MVKIRIFLIYSLLVYGVSPESSEEVEKTAIKIKVSLNKSLKIKGFRRLIKLKIWALIWTITPNVRPGNCGRERRFANQLIKNDNYRFFRTRISIYR